MTLERSSRFFSVDRFEGGIVVLIGDNGTSHDLPRSRLPQPLREGDILAVPLDERGTPNWQAATLDEAERSRRVINSKSTLDRLRSRDPRGDVTL